MCERTGATNIESGLEWKIQQFLNWGKSDLGNASINHFVSIKSLKKFHQAWLSQILSYHY